MKLTQQKLADLLSEMEAIRIDGDDAIDYRGPAHLGFADDLKDAEDDDVVLQIFDCPWSSEAEPVVEFSMAELLSAKIEPLTSSALLVRATVAGRGLDYLVQFLGEDRGREILSLS